MGISAKDISADLKPEGSLRDIYVENTELSDWKTFLEGIQNRKESFGYAIAGTEKWQSDIPSVEELFRKYKKETPGIVRFQIANATAMCHFFVEEEIEINIDPRELESDDDLEALLAFLRWLGELLNRDVLLCHENWKEEGICTYDHKNRQLRLCEQSSAGNVGYAPPSPDFSVRERK